MGMEGGVKGFHGGRASIIQDTLIEQSHYSSEEQCSKLCV